MRRDRWQRGRKRYRHHEERSLESHRASLPSWLDDSLNTGWILGLWLLRTKSALDVPPDVDRGTVRERSRRRLPREGDGSRSRRRLTRRLDRALRDLPSPTFEDEHPRVIVRGRDRARLELGVLRQELVERASLTGAGAPIVEDDHGTVADQRRAE